MNNCVDVVLFDHTMLRCPGTFVLTVVESYLCETAVCVLQSVETQLEVLSDDDFQTNTSVLRPPTRPPRPPHLHGNKTSAKVRPGSLSLHVDFYLCRMFRTSVECSVPV